MLLYKNDLPITTMKSTQEENLIVFIDQSIDFLSPFHSKSIRPQRDQKALSKVKGLDASLLLIQHTDSRGLKQLPVEITLHLPTCSHIEDGGL